MNCLGYRQVYDSDRYIIFRYGKFVGFGYYFNKMFRLNIISKFFNSENSAFILSSSSSKIHDSMVCHAKLGHVNFRRMREMSKDGLIPAFDIHTDTCKTCMLTKVTKQPFPTVERKSAVLELIHSDLCNFHSTPSLGNNKYVVTFIDDNTRFCYVYLLHAKDEALEKFKIYKTEVELQLSGLIKCLRTDRGGEYIDPQYFQSVGIVHETTAPYTPQQRGFRTEKSSFKRNGNSMLSYSGLSEGFWERLW